MPLSWVRSAKIVCLLFFHTRRLNDSYSLYLGWAIWVWSRVVIIGRWNCIAWLRTTVAGRNRTLPTLIGDLYVTHIGRYSPSHSLISLHIWRPDLGLIFAVDSLSSNGAIAIPICFEWLLSSTWTCSILQPTYGHRVPEKKEPLQFST